MNYKVYRVVLQGQDGNRGVEYENVASFKNLKDAEEYVKSRTDTNGWVSYEIKEK